MSRRKTDTVTKSWRLNVVRFGFVLFVGVLIWRLADIQIINPDFLRNQGDARHLREVPVAAHRGMIMDRNGEPLAISTPVNSVWLNPQVTDPTDPSIAAMARLLGLDAEQIKNKVLLNPGREFVYLKRRITPDLAQQIQQLNIAGVALQREYKRYYPAGEVTAHVLGFTNIDDVGQEGLELTYDAQLTGVPGLKRMVRDSHGNYVEGGEQLKPAKDGRNLQLSLDLRLQYLTYQALKKAVNKHQASSGSAVIVDVDTGEVLSMVSQPAFNPNNRHNLKTANLRNRAVTDLFEPGSTVKPFTVVSALKSGQFDKDTIINTHPGIYRVSGHPIRDFRDYGEINLTTLLKKSSNVAASKIALELEPDVLWQDFANFGLASDTGAYFPGEVLGQLPEPSTWRKLDRATLAFGYGVSSSALQLARAYTVLGNGGILQPLSFVKREGRPQGKRVFSSDLMRQVVTMMETVTQTGGTAQRAAVANYSVAGKTGTTKKIIDTGYADDRYQSLFAGLIPASDPQLAMVVVVDDPKGDEYYGGAVAAPVFSEVMTGAMRLLDITPDALPMEQLQVAGP